MPEHRLAKTRAAYQEPAPRPDFYEAVQQRLAAGTCPEYVMPENPRPLDSAVWIVPAAAREQNR
jgi:hypothetical protein